MNEVRFFLVSFSLLVVLGIPAAYSLVQDPLQSPASEMLESSNRSPASVGEVPTTVGKNSAKAHSVTLDWNCNGKTTEQEVVGTHLRLKGHLCGLQKSDSLSVVNESNGYTAAVILTGDQQFTTDFIELADGNNQFRIAYLDEDGKKQTHHLLIKKVPGSFLRQSASVE